MERTDDGIESAAAVPESLEGVDDSDLVERLIAARRLCERLSEGRAPQEDVDKARDRLESIKTALDARRLERFNSSVIARKRRQPLRDRILQTLAIRRATPSEIAVELECARETVTRILKELEESELVSWHLASGDNRRHLYELTLAGSLEIAEGRSATSGDALRVTRLDYSAVDAIVRRAVDAALTIRRTSGDLVSCIDRLEVARDIAVERGATALAIYATHELATSYRHQGDWPRVRALTQSLNGAVIAGFDRSSVPETHAALAHFNYETGRYAGPEGLDPQERVDHLKTAIVLYETLGSADHLPVEDWRMRTAWANAGLATVYREMWNLKSSELHIEIAEQTFREHDDSYGLTDTQFQSGFCYRLRGRFHQAENKLEAAAGIARAHGYERLLCTTLVQYGDTLRCLGLWDRGLEALEEAASLGRKLDMTVAQAFALASRGAICFSLGRIAESIDDLRQARRLFGSARHSEGEALALRRLAVATREDQSGFVGSRSRWYELLQDSQSRYESLQSPAGVVACFIAKARADIDSERIGGVLDCIVDRLQWPEEFMSVARDPCVPGLIEQLAEDANDDRLRKVRTRMNGYMAKINPPALLQSVFGEPLGQGQLFRVDEMAIEPEARTHSRGRAPIF